VLIDKKTHYVTFLNVFMRLYSNFCLKSKEAIISPVFFFWSIAQQHNSARKAFNSLLSSLTNADFLRLTKKRIC